jgi:hypothetical protein
MFDVGGMGCLLENNKPRFLAKKPARIYADVRKGTDDCRPELKAQLQGMLTDWSLFTVSEMDWQRAPF